MRILILLLIAFNSLWALDSKEQLSFYRGYLIWKEHLQKSDIPYDFAQVLAGMQAAERGETLDCSQEEIQSKMQEYRKQLAGSQAKENLADTELYLAKIAQEPGMVELVPQKLYYKQLKKGSGKQVEKGSTPTLVFSLFTYSRQGKEPLIREKGPLPMAIQNTIPGFAQGVTGMQEKEIRLLFIHPDLACGTIGKLDPNQILISKVEVISTNNR